jgi:arginine N-succinyltransferase
MLIIRPIKLSDYNSLYQIAIDTGHGFTSLPVNELVLKNKIKTSISSFKKDVKNPGQQSYLLVLEDTETQEILGTSGIEAAVGLDSPFYHYHLGTDVHSCKELNVYNTVNLLRLCNDLSKTTEICTLFLKEKARINQYGRFLSRVRFLFMAEHPHRFSHHVIAEMRGISNEQGKSPFWGWLEKYFFSIDFPTADYLTGIGNKTFIAQLMPKYPIYTSLLSHEAQAAINQVHKKTIPALKLLEFEGFSRSGYIDIFDAGPTLMAETKKIKTIQKSQSFCVQYDDIDEGTSSRYMLYNKKIENFRAVYVSAKICLVKKHVFISREIAGHLCVSENDSLRLL